MNVLIKIASMLLYCDLWILMVRSMHLVIFTIARKMTSIGATEKLDTPLESARRDLTTEDD
jgi:hypothetical protein